MSAAARRRDLHPVAWWGWALLLATAASRTLNPMLLLAVIVVAAVVVAARRPCGPWAASFRAFIVLGVLVMTVRLIFEVFFGAPIPGSVVFRVPTLNLPDWMAGVRLGGAVTSEALVAALYSGLQLLAIFACLGAAQALANPSRLLKCVPGALYEVGLAVVVALTLVPASIVRMKQVREARRLRGGSDKGLASVVAIAVTVLQGALERSLDLAAAMDSRGYGRMHAVSSRDRWATSAFMLGGTLGVLIGGFALLDAQTSTAVSLTTVMVGLVIALFGFSRANSRAVRTVYRPDEWGGAEWLTVVSGAVPAVAAVVIGTVDPAALLPVTNPLTWPVLPVVPFVALLLAVLPAWLTPMPALQSLGANKAALTQPRFEEQAA